MEEPVKQKKYLRKKKFKEKPKDPNEPRRWTTYAQAKFKAMKVWEKKYFTKIMEYYVGHSHSFIARAIQMDRANFVRKLREHSLVTKTTEPTLGAPSV